MIKVDASNFNIDAFVEKAKGRTRAFVVEFVQDLNEEIVRTTPVRTGFLRASWYAALGSSAAAAGGQPAGDPLSRMNLVAARLGVGDVFTAINGAAYARFVHDGTSTMHPRPWVATVIDRASLIAEAAARRVAER